MLPALLVLAQAAPPAPTVRPDPCYREEMHGTAKVSVYLGVRTCVDLSEPRTFEGIWFNDFEGSRFVEHACTPAEAISDPGGVWLDREDLLKPTDLLFGPYGRAHRIRFIGRSAEKSGSGPLDGYGHMNMSRDLVVVDEILSLQDLGATAGMRRKAR